MMARPQAFIRVSIHALVKSATFDSNQTDWTTTSFNPRAREERDFPRLLMPQNRASFNPRAREERDSLCLVMDRPSMCFNPRAREERDPRSLPSLNV